MFQWHVAFNLALIVAACCVAILIVSHLTVRRLSLWRLLSSAAIGLSFAISFAALTYCPTAGGLGAIVRQFLFEAHFDAIAWFDVTTSRLLTALNLGFVLFEYFDKLAMCAALLIAMGNLRHRMNCMAVGAAVAIGYAAVVSRELILGDGTLLPAVFAHTASRSVIYGMSGAIVGYLLWAGSTSGRPFKHLMFATTAIFTIDMLTTAIFVLTRAWIDTLATHRDLVLDNAIVSLFIFTPLGSSLFVPMLCAARRQEKRKAT